MASRSASRLSRAELAFWEESFLRDKAAILSAHDGRIADRPGLTHLCEELAWEAIDALRRAVKGHRHAR